jgi:hypothetical protein
MDKDKAIRSAKLTAAGILDKARARTAVTRAGGQIAPSKYLPNVPRAVHAGGGKVEGDNGHIYVVHGGSDFDQINPSYSGRGEPGDIRPLGKGLYGYVIDHADPENFKNAIGWATRYSQKYGGGKKALHVFKIPKSSSTVFNGDREIDPKLYPNAEGYPKPIKGLADEPTAELNAYEAHRANRPPNADPAWWDWSNKSTALKNALKNAADLRMEHLPIGLTEVAIQNPKVATRIGKFSLDTPTSDILDAVKDDAQARADGGSVTDTDEFRNWFGNSVTHTDGDPHVFYTGTSKDKDFTSFNVGRHGAWFTRDPALASEYAERNDSQGYKQDGWKLTPINTASRVIPAYVKAENPYTGDLPDEVLRSNYKAAQSDWFDTLRRKGHDAWIPARHNGDLVVALKEPQQIKSIFNNGKFDPNQKHMNKAGGGSATGSLREKALWPSAQAIKAGTGSREAHAEMVNKIKPVSPYAAPVPPASDEQVHDALTKDKQPKAFAPRGLEEGTPVAVRLDIPAYEKKNTWVVSVHHPKTDFTAGEVIGYDSVAHIGNPRFGVHPTGALNIASGKPKSTIATVHGNWKKTTPEDAFALSQTIHNDPQWRQVGMDPERHSYFYDRETQEPVMAADEALHIGPLVYAKNPVYGKKTDFAFSKGGTAGKAGGGEVEGVEGNNQNGVTGNENETAPLNLAPRAQAGGLPDAGGIRGGIGVLQAQNEASLEGLPTKVSIPLTGGSVSAGHDPRIRQIARDYMASTGLPYNPPTKYAKVDPKRASRIAAAYDEMKDNASDPLTKASYDAMIKETMAQYHAAKNAGFKAEFWNPDTEEDPYKASPRLATEDVRNNHHMWVYPTRSGYGSDGPITAKELEENPLLQDSGETWNGQPATVNDIFRAVHDYYGHAKEGVGFRGDGEENAWRSHASMYSPLARMAMTSETRGQNSWLNYGVHGEKNRNARTEDTVFAPQKVGILPHWAHHEGAEDFMGPEEVNAMAAIRKTHGRASGGSVDAALALTRRFTKDGKAATVALKPKGK